MNFRAVIAVLGFILGVIGLLMATAIPVSLMFGENDADAFIISVGITLLASAGMWLVGRKERHEVKIREGFAVVALGWIFASLVGCLPFMISGAIPSFTDAFFETMSGFTTTGSSILTNIESLPHGILFWRSITQWIGGMGMILLSVAILPLLGIGGMQLFAAEASGLTLEKLTPRISQTARILWMVYAALTAALVGLLHLGGISWFDAVCHGFTTLSSGGFSTKNTSIAFFPSPFIQYVIIIFMFLAGTNFTLHYRFLKGDVKGYFKDNEFLFYFALILTVSIFMVPWIPSSSVGSFEEQCRAAIFQTVSIISTTGFVSKDYELWAPAAQLVLLLMLFNGGSAGSTAGGIKIVRILLLLKNGYNEIKKLVHPKAIIPIRFNRRGVDTEIISDVQAFFVLYISLFAFMTIIMTVMGVDIISAAGAVATTMANAGPGLGSVGGVDNFAHIPTAGKWILTFCMLAGRLELFTVLVILAPAYWRK